jgi:hypothetical protein
MSNPPTTDEARAINASTLVNVGLVIVLLGAVFSGTRWASGLESHIVMATDEQRHRMELLDLKVEQLRAEIQTRMTERWTRSDQTQYHSLLELWIKVFRAENPNLSVPEIGKIPERRDL